MKGLQQLITSPLFQGKRTSRRITKAFGWLAERRLPKPVLRYLIHKYAKAFEINLNEYEFELSEARSFQEFFLRKFKKGQRNFTGQLASPAEGFITASGAIENGQLWQVKGSYYTLDTLLQEEGFVSGSFVTIYLGLGDYHHVHMPFSASVEKVFRIVGEVYATNEKALRQKEQVYCENERLIIKGSGRLGKFIMILVGATCVGKIRISSDELEKNKYPVRLTQADPVAAFHMGSTVILILENEALKTLAKEPGDRIVLGEKMIG